MRKLFFLALLALVVLSSNGAYAATCNGNTDKFSSDQWCISSADTLIPTASAGMQVVYEKVTSFTSGRSLLAKETGKVITDMGTVSGPTLLGFGSKFILPRAAPGLTYTFSVGSRSFTTVDTLDTSDTILNSIAGTGFAAGESLKSTGQAGDSVTVTSTAANQWSITAMRGSWTNNGTN